MNFFERRQSSQNEEYDISDYEDRDFHPLLKKLPEEIALKSIGVIESRGFDENEATHYIESVVKQRKEAVTKSVISDEYIKIFFEGQEEKIYNDIETTVFTDSENHLGAGLTARVKEYTLLKNGVEMPMAIKYVVTPTKKTLSASGEHDVIREVERIEDIEKIELSAKNSSKYIRVPHPYFHHRNESIQCYGMELVCGTDVKHILDGNVRPSIIDDLQNSPLLNVDQRELSEQIDNFFNTMHEYCLHGDIKPANIMIGTNGMIYIIDFGQSILKNEITEKALDQFEELKKDEAEQTKTIVMMALDILRKNTK
jgi:tRNA A-37 threonylcarbamoyl transferase component Bud32